MGDVEYLCDRVILVDSGTIVQDSTVDELLDQIDTTRTLLFRFQEECEARKYAKSIRGEVGNMQLKNRSVTAIVANDSGIVRSLIRRAADYDLEDIVVSRPTLEEALVQYYEK